MHKQNSMLSFFSNFNSLIRSDEFLVKHRLNEKFFTRNRKLGFSDIILFLLRLPQKTLSAEMSDCISDIISKKGIERISKQAFSQARQKISHLAFTELLDFTYQNLCSSLSHDSKWNGHTVKAIDGTTFRVPNTAENKIYFQTQVNQTTEVALIRASTLYNVSADLTEKAVLGKYRDSERAQAIEMLSYDSLHEDTQLRPIVTFDRGYPSGELINHFVKNDGLFLMRCSTATFKKVLDCPQGDNEIFIEYKDKSIKLRVIRFFLNKDTEEILITNLFDDSISIQDFKELYFLRWSIEVKYREIKQQLKTENYTGTKPVAIHQEIYASLVFSNIASALKYLVDQKINEDTSHKSNKRRYQANRNFLIGALKKNFHLLLGKSPKMKKALKSLIFLATKERTPILNFRSHPRKNHYYKKTVTYCMNQRSSL